MTCTQMLERLIEADPDALAGHGTSAVATHVRECARCRAVAEQLLVETRMLASVIDRGAVVRRIRPAPVILAIAAAAAVAFVMLPHQSGSPAIAAPSQAPVAAAAPTAVAPVVVSPALREATPVTGERARRASRSTTGPATSRTAPAVASSQARQARVATPYPTATPVTIAPMQVTQSELTHEQVAVTPPPGKRVAVMRTGDPTITVVWVY